MLRKFSIAVTSLLVAALAAGAAMAGAPVQQPLGALQVNDYVYDETVTSAATLIQQPTGGYPSFNFQFTSIGVGNSVRPQISNDNSTWVDAVCAQASAPEAAATKGAFAIASSTTYSCSTPLRFFKMAVSTYGSGTVTMRGNFRYQKPEGTANVTAVVPVSGSPFTVRVDQTTPGTTNLVQEPDALVANGTCAAACNGTTLVSFDTGVASGYKSIQYQLTAAGSGTLTFQVSNDNSTWVALNCRAVGIQAPTLVGATNGSFAGISVCQVDARYWRAQFTAYSSGTFTAVAYARSNPVGFTAITGGVGVQPYPADALLGVARAVPFTISATGTTSSTAATLPASATKTNYLCGFSVRSNATAAATGNITVAGTITGTLNYTHFTAPLASGIGVTEPPIGPYCIPGSGINTAIVVTAPAPGAGGVVSVTAWGFQL